MLSGKNVTICIKQYGSAVLVGIQVIVAHHLKHCL